MSKQEVTEDQNGSAGCDKGPFHFLDALPVGIFIALPGGVPYYANREAVRLLGRGDPTTSWVDRRLSARLEGKPGPPCRG